MLLATILVISLILVVSYALFFSNPFDPTTNNESVVKNLSALVFYKSNGAVLAHQFQEMLNQSMLVELWDITANPFPTDATILGNSSLVFIDGGIDYHDFDSDQIAAVWSAIYDGTSFFFNYRNAEMYYDKFGVAYTWDRTNYVLLKHNHPVLAPSFLYSAGTGWHSLKDINDEWANSFLANSSALPSDHRILLECNNTQGKFSFPMAIYGTHGDGKFAVITGRTSELESTDNYGMRWVVPRVTYWLLPDDQPLRRYWSYLSVAFRDDDLGGIWAGSLENQLSNMSMVLSWKIPLTWAFACNEYSREIWADPSFVMKLKELEEAGHELFLHSGGYASEWQNYSYAEAKTRIEELTENYVQVLGHAPRGWVTPQHGYSDTLVHVLEELNFKYDSENRESLGTTLLTDKVIDVSAMYHVDFHLNAYKDSVDRVWLFGGKISKYRVSSPRILVFYTHFYGGDLKRIDPWINDFKTFLSNYQHQWITLDELAYTVHGQPNAHVNHSTSNGTHVILEVDSATETTFVLELKNSTISGATANGTPIHFRSNSSLTTRIDSGKTEIILEVGNPGEDVTVIRSDSPPTGITLEEHKLTLVSSASEGRNTTIQIRIPVYDSWDASCTEDWWGKRWNSTTRILTIWTISDGAFTITINFGDEDLQ